MKSNIKFYVFTKKGKLLKKGLNAGEAPVYIRVILDNSRREEFAIRGLSCKVEDWDAVRGKIAGRTPSVAKKNSMIDQKIASIIKIVEDVERDYADQIHPDIIINRIKGKDGKTKDGKNSTGKICEQFEEHNKNFKSLVDNGTKRISTLKRYETTLRLLRSFIKKKYNLNDYSTALLDYSFVVDFQNFLIVERKCGNNTTVKYLKNFKKIVIDAQKRGLVKIDPFLGTRFTLDKVNIEFLTIEELDYMMSKNITNQRLERVRDCFVFSCFTGLAYCDLNKLSSEKIIIDNKQKCIVGPRTKTKESYTIPLLTPALEILKKYENDPYCLIKGKLLPVQSNQRYNEYLKEIAAICNINKNLHTHIGRHTAATTLLTYGVPIEVVSKILGHSSIKMTEHYAKVIRVRIISEMKDVDEKLKTYYANAVPAEL